MIKVAHPRIFTIISLQRLDLHKKSFMGVAGARRWEGTKGIME